MTTRTRFLVATLGLFVSLVLTACSKDSSPTVPTAPTSPTTPSTPTVTNFTINGLDAIRSGFYYNFTAQASMSDGSTQTVAPSWTSGTTNVASVAANGDVTGVSNGDAMITATYQGRTASKGVHIVSNFGGNWTGTYRITKCDQSAGFAGWCAGVGGVGAVLPLELALTQGGTSRDQLTGNIALGAIVGSTSGNVTGDGRLNLGGRFTDAIGSTVFVITVGGWDTRLSGSSGMTGGFAWSVTANGSAGNAYQENQLSSMTHTNVGSSVRSFEGVVTLPMPTVSGDYNMPLSQFFQRMRGQ